MIGFGEEEDWEISVLMNELDVPFFFFFCISEENNKMKQHPSIYWLGKAHTGKARGV